MRKILVIILFAVAGAFADHVLPLSGINFFSVGYSSLGRIETDVFNLRIWHEGSHSDQGGLFIGFNALRFDVRTSYDDVEYDHPPVSLGASMVTVPVAGLAFADVANFAFVPKSSSTGCVAALIAAFLASGELAYNFSFPDVEYFDLSVFESHVFEWWLYKKNGKWHMDEVGWGQELGLEMKFPFVGLDIGAQFEITNKQKGIGWFARVKLIDIFELFQ